MNPCQTWSPVDVISLDSLSLSLFKSNSHSLCVDVYLSYLFVHINSGYHL